MTFIPPSLPCFKRSFSTHLNQPDFKKVKKQNSEKKTTNVAKEKFTLVPFVERTPSPDRERTPSPDRERTPSPQPEYVARPGSSLVCPPTPRVINPCKLQNVNKSQYWKNTKKIRKLVNKKNTVFQIYIEKKIIEINSTKHIGHGDFNDAYLVKGSGVGDGITEFVLKIPLDEKALDIKQTLSKDIKGYFKLKEAFKESNGGFRIATYYNLDLLNEEKPAVPVGDPLENTLSGLSEKLSSKGGNEATEGLKSELKSANELSVFPGEKTPAGIAEEKPAPYKSQDLLNTVHHGCYLVEYAPDSLPSDIFNDENSKQKLKNLFKFAWDNKNTLPLDLKKANVMMKDGEIVIVDPMHPQGDMFNVLLRQALESFDTIGSDLYNYLDPRTEKEKEGSKY